MAGDCNDWLEGEPTSVARIFLTENNDTLNSLTKALIYYISQRIKLAYRFRISVMCNA